MSTATPDPQRDPVSRRHVARAKRTDRAEARRRHRALAAEPLADEPDRACPILRVDRPGAGDPRPDLIIAPLRPDAVGIVEAFRRSTGPADLRGDLASLPWLARHTKAIWVPAVVVAVATILLLLPEGRPNPIGSSSPARRSCSRRRWRRRSSPASSRRAARWLAGGIAGLFAALGYSLLVLTVAPAASPTVVDQAAPAPGSLIAYALISSPLFGVASARSRASTAGSSRSRTRIAAAGRRRRQGTTGRAGRPSAVTARARSARSPHARLAELAHAVGTLGTAGGRGRLDQRPDLVGDRR